MGVILDKSIQLHSGSGDGLIEQAKHDQVNFLFVCINLYSRKMVMFWKLGKLTSGDEKNVFIWLQYYFSKTERNLES